MEKGPVLDSLFEEHLENSACDDNVHEQKTRRTLTRPHADANTRVCIQTGLSRLRVFKAISRVRVAGVCSALRPISRPPGCLVELRGKFSIKPSISRNWENFKHLEMMRFNRGLHTSLRLAWTGQEAGDKHNKG